MSIVLFLLMFGIIVIAHEFGHFLLAKVNGIHVVEFSVGMGPKLFKFQKGETEYTLRLLPLGGACIFEGEDGLVTEKTKEEGGSVEESENKGAFHNAKVTARIATVIAGPLFNFILAFLFSLIIVGSVGSDRAYVAKVRDGYPAKEAGIESGDEIIRMNGERVYLRREISLISMLNTEGEEIEVEYRRDGKEYKTTLVPRYSEEDGRYLIGLEWSGDYEIGGPLNVIKNSYYEVRYWIKYTFKSLGMLFTGKAGMDDLSGPVGVAQVVDEVYEVSAAISVKAVIINMLNFAVLLTANLGVINLLPLPALDGGRLVFLLIELVRGKPVPREKEGMVHFIGMVLLLILMVFVFYNDIKRLFI